MGEASKFLFETEFAANKPKARGQRVWDIPPTEQDLVRVRDEGFAAGRAAGRADAEAETARIEAQALERFSQAFLGLKAAREASLQDHTRDAASLAVAVAKKLASTLIAAQPLAEIETVLTDCLARVIGEARIVVRVHESLLDSLQAKIDPLARRLGFDGQVILLGEADIALGDCRVEWADGGVKRDIASIAEQIDQAVMRLVEPGEGKQPSSNEGTGDDELVPAHDRAQRDVGDSNVG